MCKRSCYYRAGFSSGYEKHGNERSCNYSSITGHTRTAELVEAYREKGRKLTEKEKKRILTDEAHCPWYQPPGLQKKEPVQITLFNSRSTITERKCSICGNTFAGGRRALYCPDCREIKKKEMQEAWRGREFGIICPDCGKTFIGHYQAKYCPECRARRRAEGGRKRAERTAENAGGAET